MRGAGLWWCGGVEWPFDHERDGGLLGRDSGAVEPGSVFLELLAVVSCDDDEGVLITIVFFKESDETRDFVVSPSEGVEVSVANEFDITR